VFWKRAGIDFHPHIENRHTLSGDGI
jgi:hypothetical protein